MQPGPHKPQAPVPMPLQVAAHAGHHVKVSKKQDGQGRATTVFSQLAEPAARLEEVAAMLGLGTDVAADMMAAAQGWPAQQVQQLLADWKGPAGEPQEVAQVVAEAAGAAGSGAGQQGVELDTLVGPGAGAGTAVKAGVGVGPANGNGNGSRSSDKGAGNGRAEDSSSSSGSRLVGSGR